MIGILILIIITALTHLIAFLHFITLPNLFTIFPIFFLTMIGVLSLIARKYEKGKKTLDVGAILGYRMLFLLISLIIFGIGIWFNKTNILTYTLLFVLFYTVFAVVETKTLINLTKKDK